MTCEECFHYKACCSIAGTTVLVEAEFGGCEHYINADDVVINKEVERDASHDIEIDM